jgi:CRISPR-associated protein Cas1
MRTRFNSGVQYNERVLKWDTAIEQKAKELARYLVKKSRQADFAEPSPELKRSDNMELRKRILGLSQTKARKLGICKGTLHHLRENAKRDCSFKLYAKVRDKLQSEVTCG